ncbi:MAG: HD domain-containing phosphohydrolase [Thermodesulfobacteriota bacterium]
MNIGELEPGMYVCGVEKAGSDGPVFFMNSILIKNEKDLAGFAGSAHRFVYVEMNDPVPKPAPETPPAKTPEDGAQESFDDFQAIEPMEEVGEPEQAPELTEPGAEEPFSFESAYFEPEAPEAAEAPAQEVVEEAAQDAGEQAAQAEVYVLDRHVPSTGGEEAPLAEGLEEPAQEAQEIEGSTGPADGLTGQEAEDEAQEPPGPPVPVVEPLDYAQAAVIEEACVMEAPSETAAPEAAVDGPAPATEAPAQPAPEVEDTVAFEEELIEAKEVRNEAESLVRDFMGRVRIDGEIMPDTVNSTVDRMVQSVFKNQDALASLSRLKSRDDYTFAHCVNVCILSLALARHMGFNEAELHEIGVGAILHDVGKMLVPEEILKKPGRLTDGEFSEMKRHPALGYELLHGTNEVSEASRSMLLHHHEKFDGTGYLEKLSGTGIHVYARIASVADVYDAMTSDRCYQKGMHPEVALRRMYRLRGVAFDGEVVERLIKCLGIYPIGTFVELNTGEMAVVNMPNHLDPLKPKVLMLFDSGRRRLPRPFDIDLKADGNRWITSSKAPGPLAGFIEKLIA